MSGSKPERLRELINCVFRPVADTMRQHRDSFVSGSFRQGGLLGLFLAAMLLVLFGFAMTLWELRHDLASIALLRP